MTTTKTRLQAGGTVRIYRDGTELHSSVVVPARGPLTLRHLPPGSYVARDELGAEREFEVGVKDESVVVQGSRSELDGSSAEPGAASVQSEEHRDVGLQPGEGDGPIYPDGERFVSPDAPAEADVPVLGEPGSSLVESEPEYVGPREPRPRDEEGDEDDGAR